MKIYEAITLLEKGEISPLEIAEEVIGAIKTRECDIKAYITLCDDIREQSQNAVRGGRMWGIPIAVKDNICTKGLRTTAGSRMLGGFVPPYDATVVKRLKENGAVIAGKTNMDEFGMGSDSRYSAYKVTSNPVNGLYVPGGSSGGSAAAVKAGMAMGALGTDTGGSIRQPAAFCGIYALKPTYSLVSRFGLIAFASSLDCIGAMGNSVKDVAIMTDVISGYDEKDATSANRVKEAYFENLTPSVKGMRIGVCKEFLAEASPCVKEAILKAAKRYEEMGAFVEECSIDAVRYAVSSYYIISSCEASSNLARYDSVRFGYRTENYESYEDMCIKSRSEAFGEEVKRRILLGTYALSEENYDLYYMKARIARKKIKDGFKALFEKYDLIISPVSPAKVPKAGENCEVDEIYEKDVCTASVSLAGLPAMSVPCGSDENGLPIGMQIIGDMFKEQIVLNASLCYEEGGFCNV